MSSFKFLFIDNFLIYICRQTAESSGNATDGNYECANQISKGVGENGEGESRIASAIFDTQDKQEDDSEED